MSYNISFLAEKLPYSKICGTKVGPSYKNGVIANLVVAMSFGMLFLCPLKSLSLYFHERKSLATQIGSCGVSVGQFVFAPVIAHAITAYTVNGVFLLLSGIVFNIYIAAFLFRPVMPSNPRTTLDTNDTPVQFDKNIFKICPYYLYLVAQTLMACGDAGAILYMAPVAISKFDLDTSQAARSLQFMALMELIFRIPWGILADKKVCVSLFPKIKNMVSS